jgi:uncharacterized protein (DUF697 family)
MDEQKTPNLIKEQKSVAMGYALFEVGLEFAVMIALPLIGGILGGKWLDTRTGHHFFVIIGILTALALSSYMIYKKILQVKEMMK